jgi:hypothetical protein
MRVVLVALGLSWLLSGCGGRVSSDAADGGSNGTDAAVGGEPQPDGSAVQDATTALDGRVSDEGADVDANAGLCGFVEGSSVCFPCPGAVPSGTCDVDGLLCNYASGPCSCTNGCTPGECCPQTCAQLGFPCAPAGDGCGGLLHCRQCPTGSTCGNDDRCTTAPDAGCTVSCGHQCGVIDDGCGGTLDCGECFWQCGP